jgi:hypothetical protein
VPCDCGRTDIEGDPIDILFEAWPDRDNTFIAMDSGGDSPFSLTQNLLQILHHAKISAQTRQLPLLFEGAFEAAEVTSLSMHVRLIDLDIIELHDRVELDVTNFRTLSDDLAVHLAFRWHIDYEVASQRGLASQSPAFFEALSPIEARFDLASRRGMAGCRGDAMLRELALAERHLTTPAKTAPAANRIQVNTEFLRRL